MCHLVVLMPVLGLAVFWLWPPSIAIPIYLLILVVSLLHEVGEVVDATSEGWAVRVHGELWRATSADALKPRDAVEVTGMQGLVLRVRKSGPART